MFGLFIASTAYTLYQIAKEKLEPTIPAEKWANKDLYYKDMMNGVSAEQRMKNVRNGKYILNVNHPEPHRNKDGKIIIENNSLFKEDLNKYGAYQTYKWADQGKYNL
jgi:hypothetical protein